MTRVLFGAFAVLDALLLSYLVEKYLVQSWRVRWPVPIVPLTAIGMAGWTERLMRVFCELARNGEGCHRYALLMEKHPEAADRAFRYRQVACKRGYALAERP